MQLFLQTHFVMMISQPAATVAANHCVPESTAAAGAVWPPSHAGSFAVQVPLLVRLVAQGGVAGARRPRTAPFARVSRQSRLSWDALAARMADPIEASGSLDPCRALKVTGRARERKSFQATGSCMLRVQRGCRGCESVLYTPGSPGAPGAP